jgi:hypothetical protein
MFHARIPCCTWLIGTLLMRSITMTLACKTQTISGIMTSWKAVHVWRSWLNWPLFRKRSALSCKYFIELCHDLLRLCSRFAICFDAFSTHPQQVRRARSFLPSG